MKLHDVSCVGRGLAPATKGSAPWPPAKGILSL